MRQNMIIENQEKSVCDVIRRAPGGRGGGDASHENHEKWRKKKKVKRSSIYPCGKVGWMANRAPRGLTIPPLAGSVPSQAGSEQEQGDR